MNSDLWAILIFALVLIKTSAQIWLNRLNRRHVRAHAGSIPEAHTPDGVLAIGIFESPNEFLEPIETE